MFEKGIRPRECIEQKQKTNGRNEKKSKAQPRKWMIVVKVLPEPEEKKSSKSQGIQASIGILYLRLFDLNPVIPMIETSPDDVIFPWRFVDGFNIDMHMPFWNPAISTNCLICSRLGL